MNNLAYRGRAFMRWVMCAIILALAGCRGASWRESYVPARAVDTHPAPPSARLLPPISHAQLRRMPSGVIQVVAFEQEAQPGQGKKPQSMLDRLRFPEGVLAIPVPDIQLPPPTAKAKEREAAIQKQFPPLPKPAPLPDALPGPAGKAVALEELERIALASNPRVRQARQDVEAARGAAIQAGLYPNPVVGYQTDTLGQANSVGQRSAGQQGGFIEQTIKTPGKLKLARLAAQYDVEVTAKKLKQAEADVLADVRSQYFAVLSARRNFDVTQALTKLTDEVYTVLLLQLQIGEVAAYEPMQTRVLAMQSRGLLVQARNRYISAWRQLAAALGTPEMPLTEIAGRIDMPIPRFEREAVLRYVLANHTEVQNAHLGVERARTLLQLAELQPVPDMSVYYAMQRDMTSSPQFLSQNIAVGFALPLFDRNQGNIHQARALLQRAMQEENRARTVLSARLAEAFERYDNNRQLLEMYKTQMLPNQVQAFRAAVARHAALGEKNVSYNDLVTAQQTLASLINSYLGALNEQWVAVVDIGQLLQTDDLFRAAPLDEVAPVPDVHEIYRGGPLHRRRERHAPPRAAIITGDVHADFHRDR